MPTHVAIISLLAFIFLMGFILDLFKNVNPLITILVVIGLFLLGWFVVWGIISKNSNQTVIDGAKEGVQGLKMWLKYMIVGIVVALILFILFS